MANQINGYTIVYTGAGVWPVSASLTEKMIASHIDSRVIKSMENLLNLPQDTKTVILPGGHAIDMINGMELPAASMRAFVENGGNLFGICAGATFPSHTLISKATVSEGCLPDEFHPQLRSGQLTIHEQNLSRNPKASLLYPGKVVAPHIVKNYKSAKDQSNISAVKVAFNNGDSFHAYSYSGPAFIDTPQEAKVLLRYVDPIELVKIKKSPEGQKISWIPSGEKIVDLAPVAALSYPVKEGKLVLTGIHPEMDPAFYADPTFPNECKADDQQRKVFVRLLMNELAF